MKIRKSEYTLLIISLCIVIVGIIQTSIIIEQYRQKSNFFDLQYSQVVTSAFNDYKQSSFSNPLDSAFNEYNLYVLKVIPILEYKPGDYISDSAKLSIANILLSYLEHYDNSKYVVKEKLTEANLDTTFSVFYSINSLSLIDFDINIPIIQEVENQSPNTNSWLSSNRIIHETNFFAADINIDFDFTRKRIIIFREMSGILLITLFTLVVILFTFWYTLRTLNKQKKLSELKSDFIDNISHEFKTPLSSISLAASTLKHPVVGSNLMKRIELSNNILHQNKILNEMIDQVIDASQIVSGGLNLSLSEVKLKELLNQLIQDCKDEFKPYHIHLDMEFELPGNFSCKIDKNQIYRAVKNLIANSVKYCDSEPDIKIRVKKYNDLVIEIIDNGIGISKEEKELIFNRFYRSKRQSKNKTKGLGLGLSIVQKIITSHKGIVSIDSETGKGTKVTILLPV